MAYRNVIGAAAVGASLFLTVANAFAFDETKYPDWKGAWRHVFVRGLGGQPGLDPTKPSGAGQQAPLTPEYQKIFEENLKDQKAGGQGIDPTYTCLSPGMPRVMTTFDPWEILITPQMTNFLIQHIHDFRVGFSPMAATGLRTSRRPSSAIPSAAGSTPTATAVTTSSTSRRAA